MILKWTKKTGRFLCVFWLVILASCAGKDQGGSFDRYFEKSVSVVKYAHYFDLYENGPLKKLVIYDPFGNGGEKIFYLADSAVYDRYVRKMPRLIKIPFRRAGVLSATQVDGMIRLGLLNKLGGVADARFFVNEQVKRKLKSGEIKEVASGGRFFVETAIMSGLDIVFYSPFKKGTELELQKNILAVPYFDFMENNPLGRAEWIKITGLFFGKEKQAGQLFDQVAKRYGQLKKLVEVYLERTPEKERPSVFSGKYVNGQWYVPGGKSYVAHLFKDAGADYVFAFDSSVNSIPLDFEVVYQKAKDADYWRMLGGISTMKTPYQYLAEENTLYTRFKAFKQRHIIFCDPVKTAYFEKATLEPDVVLSDFVKVFFPSLVKDHQPVYYKLLK
jgi:iron complex transport system substrate-binding protein